MIPDPVLDKLARFTPNAALVDNGALLFAAGRASARSHWLWKVAVVGLLLANSGWLAHFIYRQNTQTTPMHDLQNQPLPAATSQPEPVTPPTNLLPASDEPWSYRALLSVGDPEQFPLAEPLNGPFQAEKPLTPRMAFRGDID
jgi:hypothetical protein